MKFQLFCRNFEHFRSYQWNNGQLFFHTHSGREKLQLNTDDQYCFYCSSVQNISKLITYKFKWWKKIQNVNVFIISSINSIFGTGKFPSYSWTVARKYHRNELTFHMFLHAKREDIRPHLDWNVKIAASFLLASEIAFPPIECWWEEKNVPQFTLIKFRNWIAFDLECWLLFFTTAISCVTGAAFAAFLYIKYEMFEN